MCTSQSQLEATLERVRSLQELLYTSNSFFLQGSGESLQALPAQTPQMHFHLSSTGHNDSKIP